MKLLENYVAKRIIYATLLMMAVVAALAFIINFLGELRDVGEGDYGMPQAAFHALLELPFSISQLFPMLVLLGGLLGLGQLAALHELIVMRASGFSLFHMARAILLAVFVLAVLGFLLGEGLAPQLHRLADVHKTTEQTSGQALITATGLWLREQQDFIQIQRVMAHKHLEGVTRYQFDTSHRMLSASFAESMDYQDGHWQVHHLVRTLFIGEQKTKSEKLAETVWDIKLNPAILNAGQSEPSEMSLNKLRYFAGHLMKNGLQAAQFQLSFWKRVLQPVSVLVMLFLAVPLVFVAPPRVSMGWRLLIGVLIGFSFYITDALVGQLSVIFQLPSFLAAIFPSILFASAGLLLWRRVGK